MFYTLLTRRLPFQLSATPPEVNGVDIHEDMDDALAAFQLHRWEACGHTMDTVLFERQY